MSDGRKLRPFGEPAKQQTAAEKAEIEKEWREHEERMARQKAMFKEAKKPLFTCNCGDCPPGASGTKCPNGEDRTESVPPECCVS